MQSSSTLFPVALLSAERRGDLSEDVYRIKAGNSPDPSVELAVTRLGLADQGQAQGVPVILLHGSFSNRRFWYSPKGVGLGAYLARAGFDVWIPEMRGHGLSPRNHDWKHNSVAAYARDDLPLIAAFVREQSGQTPHWVGHSLGGTTLAAALGGGFLAAEQVASVALFGTQISRVYWPLKVPPLAWGPSCCSSAGGRFPGRVSNVGRRMSRSAWPWKACAGMACLGALATNRATGGRGWPRWMCRCWPWLVRGTSRTRCGPAASCSSNLAVSASSFCGWGSRKASTLSGMSTCW
ncbi:alpha/beta hydrolase [Pseudomonas asiatica]|uniref:alpha/beta hydrolase n=1 Tax=Pseudomonas asiatica TaxID=2219225 RepID=UPI001CC6E0DB